MRCDGKNFKAELRRQEENDSKHPELTPEFDALYAWTSRDRVIMKRMTAFFCRREAERLRRDEGDGEAHVESDRYGRYLWSPGLIVKVAEDLSQ